MGNRKIGMSRELYIDREDFREVANRKYKRLVAGNEVRLRNSYVIRCNEVIKDADGKITELLCSYDPETLGVNPPDRKVRGVIHWVSAEHGVPAEIRLYDRLFSHPTPDADKEVDHWKEHLNPEPPPRPESPSGASPGRLSSSSSKRSRNLPTSTSTAAFEIAFALLS